MNESNGNMELYLRAHTEEIITNWLSKIYENENTYTSFVYSPRYKDELRADSEQTADLIISYFAGKKAFFAKLDKWLDNMYARRMENEVPLPEVITTLDKLRREFLSAVSDFCIENDEVTKCDFSSSMAMVNHGFDRINEAFSAMYYRDIVQHLESQHRLIEEISTPVISITDNLAILPLMGRVDRERAEKISEITANKCVKLGVEQLCIDLSGISYFDDALGEMLNNLVTVLKLLGVEAFISGIQPKMAQQINRVDLNLSIPAYHSLKAVLQDKTRTK
ncbi:STAS domain-containing protein [Listeria ivanovii]|uniref:STAS domain-containing protein n=2 Tax=Listeria ivanovii TaxID=1638 RepID=A0ABS1G7D6_LISIV|nr:STAS domain-containing protein [Listeria ivanovii]AIS58634.1 sulfate transporter [Listeria ivanovii subsp. londoniensis]MBK1962803.1 STAS domain-containing protein [Listeria ivanovii subsp. londoniensis]MBK2003933.1 STAS domain-containing protein [Listeria ivanovii subsp. londoniensis]MBM5609372.1 STAS domain-containing protein [Listeria ivanovii]MBM5637705.1 STAS domain-containing protein [Listeria ivanovii]